MNKTEKQLEQIVSFLREQTTLSLATTDEDGLPSIAPLFYMVDANLSIYWLSSATSLHSRNLLRAPQAAASVYRAAERWREIRGVQMRGPVGIVAEAERRSGILRGYCERFKLGRVLRLAVRQSVLHVLQPEYFRYLDNSRGFRSKFELVWTLQGWRPAQQGAQGESLRSGAA